MQYNCSNKKMVQALIEQCYNFGIKNVIISPGSRNAPLIISFANHPNFKCYSIPDERSAAFYALGMARKLNEPVAIICTSGTAVLNYAPAIAEAYYQEIPLIAITADRPPFMIDQEDGQTIRQHNIYANHIKFSTTLPILENDENLTIGEKEINTALANALNFPKGPVHINIPFEEPLYEFENIDFIQNKKSIEIYIPKANIKIKQELKTICDSVDNIIILSGVSLPNSELNEKINSLAIQKNIPVFAPPTANLFGDNIFNTVDSLFYALSKSNPDKYKAELLITIGGPVVSKVAKQHLRKFKPRFHVDIDVNPRKINTYDALTEQINCNPIEIIDYLLENASSKKPDFLELWQNKNHAVKKSANSFLSQVAWSDMKLFNTIFENINQSIDLHLANSTPVRYAEFFAKHPLINYYCNRGTSGIDGCTSTAAGAAIVSKNKTLLITGDISFFYDSNAFWNRHVPENLKVLLINNKGGNIFKVINGPGNTDLLNDFFVTKQTAKADKICEAFDIDYLKLENEHDFVLLFDKLMNSKCACVLEVFTDSDLSANAYRDFISAIRS
ncbi:MAG: 2-succinyl-5-enolpyruvyl-6-hydroxy-3-cyclohexene-1-carboxylic-acid synthase [Salinivirgaceae bacterium]|nr:2-succinyl-5-enolpyruvyl-6-hydroxy-3-cyclohexene-1-carboxylic-acid synthase [Salinivirgaceae bacterium]